MSVAKRLEPALADRADDVVGVGDRGAAVGGRLDLRGQLVGLDVAPAELRDHVEVLLADVGQREGRVRQFRHGEDVAHQPAGEADRAGADHRDLDGFTHFGVHCSGRRRRGRLAGLRQDVELPGPGGDRTEFRELLPAAERSGDASYHAQLLTQIARTQGLQDRFDDAHATLDSVEKMLTDDMQLARARYLLERGRVFNSSGRPAKAMPLFERAWKVAEAAKAPRHAVDAVHMLGIAAPTPEEQIEWNLRGIAMVEADPSQRKWLNALYNNLGESYAKVGEYAKALDAFEKLAAINDKDIYTMKDQARMLRAAGPRGSGGGGHPPDPRAA